MRGYSDNLCFSRAVETILQVVRPGLEKVTASVCGGGAASPSAGTGKSIVPPPLFLLYLLSNYHQTWHDSTMAQNLSRAVKVKSIMTLL